MSIDLIYNRSSYIAVTKNLFNDLAQRRFMANKTAIQSPDISTDKQQFFFKDLKYRKVNQIVLSSSVIGKSGYNQGEGIGCASTDLFSVDLIKSVTS